MSHRKTSALTTNWIIIETLIAVSNVVSCASYRPPPVILSAFGDTEGVTGGVRDYRHQGVDLAAAVGTEVIAAADGVIVGVSRDEEHGGEVVVRHEFRLEAEPRSKIATRYGHLRTISVRVGDNVKQGEPIGTVGIFRFSGGASHVHWELCNGGGCGRHFDPISYTAGCMSTRSGSNTRRPFVFPIDC